MSLFRQALLDTHDELIVDLFAGGGGASSGIEQATGRMVDVAINHDADAIAMHAVNHPQTLHLQSDVFEVDPRRVCGERGVALLWASPDWGSKPIRHVNKKRRSLAWVVTRWGAQVRPRVIALENVEEFAMWGPLVGRPDALRPCKKRKGKTFRRWKAMLRTDGYVVEHRELKACDYGAPTIRKRLFVIARCDGQPIVWPEATHGPTKKLKYRTAAECIDWSIPMCSVFATKEEAREWAKFHGQACPQRPLKPATMQRIARGCKRYVLDAEKPFLVTIAHGSDGRWGDGTSDIDAPLKTTTTKGEHAVVSPFLGVHHGHTMNSHARIADLTAPIPTLDTSNRYALTAAFMAQNNGGFFSENEGRSVDDPLSTICGRGTNQSVIAAHMMQANYGDKPFTAPDEPLHTIVAGGTHHAVVAAHIQRDFGASVGHAVDAPLGTITTDRGGHCALVASLIMEYYGNGEAKRPDSPLGTISTHDRFAVITLKSDPNRYIADIGMRMLQPRELYLCQGFRPGYIIDRGANGKPLPKSAQVRMCGNSVCPPVAEAIVKSNCPDLIVRQLTPKERKLVAA